MHVAHRAAGRLQSAVYDSSVQDGNFARHVVPLRKNLVFVCASPAPVTGTVHLAAIAEHGASATSACPDCKLAGNLTMHERFSYNVLQVSFKINMGTRYHMHTQVGSSLLLAE